MTPDRYNTEGRWIYPRPRRVFFTRAKDKAWQYREEGMPAQQWSEEIDRLINRERATLAVGVYGDEGRTTTEETSNVSRHRTISQSHGDPNLP